jgi:DNA-binding response OmpR family regulator
LADVLVRGLRRDGHAVDVAHRATDANIKLRSAGYDLVVLDWNLPDGSGLQLCRDLVSGDLPTLEGERPRILMLTARDDVSDRVAGLDSGADDYMVKPFAFPELSARVRALIRRDAESDPVLNVGPLQLDPARFIAKRDEDRLELTAKEFALLHYFMANAGLVMSQEHLLEHVWDEMTDPMTNVVRVTVSNLRKKLGEPQLISTVPGRGYRLDDD